MIDAAPAGLSVEELRSQATETFGADTTYSTCSGRAFTFDEVVAFFHQANKVAVDTEGRMSLQKQHICDGSGNH